jgi:hypothetical protein
MTPEDRRLWLALQAAKYLEAIESEDFELQEELWERANRDPELEASLSAVHAGLAEEEAEIVESGVKAAVAQHLASTEILRPHSGPVTVAMVAEELFRHTPDRLSPEAHALNDRLRTAREELPEALGLSKLIAWAEAKFGLAPREYWIAFRDAALKVELRFAAETEYQLAARQAPKPENRT